MKVPLMASLSPKTIDLRDKSLKVKMYRNSRPEVVTSPYKPYFYMEDDNGEEFKTIAKSELNGCHTRFNSM